MLPCITFVCFFGAVDAELAKVMRPVPRVGFYVVPEQFRYGFILATPGDHSSSCEDPANSTQASSYWESADSRNKHCLDLAAKRLEKITNDRTVLAWWCGEKTRSWGGGVPAIIVEPTIWHFGQRLAPCGFYVQQERVDRSLLADEFVPLRGLSDATRRLFR